ncbi:Coenzyme F420 hydrogenase/dehydrogenase, beta subunit C-terminal domain [Shimia thalassica]|uniref:Coenzyme F420 hydrogenase/dehydrogenase, beta subunit C-terminal domain n=1 Tax=Shimia thalassica TaxID=1715693 RepID=UPI0026E21025|nr:Coenzyme F420 hydrogenase/dehydrogenase, beta subunit C-terminal domain [Shimia thalassica]MDO6522779.1 Coenzyme F420 hydrogenase/dehydrogenase, beta subunit C-terminal domain [Shimia thalassica]
MTRSSDPITRAVETSLCTGCGACAGGFPELIRMVEDVQNGRRPVVSQTSQGRAAAQEAIKLCAGVGANYDELDTRDDTDRSWGPVLKVWEGWASDDEIRHRGSSGGAATALSQSMLATQSAGGVAHVVQREDDPRLNTSVISQNREELLRGAGSRYAQASPGERIEDILTRDTPTAFIGKPCDVASVAKAAKIDPALNDKLAATISIFCAGAPNINATDALLDRLSVPKDAKLTDLRYRGEGWPGLMQATYIDNTGETRKSDAISYGEGWGKVLQAGRKWRCRICADHTGEFADISVGDPWHNPPKGNTDPGRSMIVARTLRGQRIIEEAIANGFLIAEERPRDLIAAAQPNLLDTRASVFGRRLAMRLAGMPAPKDVGINSASLWWSHLNLKRKAQSVGGSLKRIIRNRLWKPVKIKAI